MAFGIIFIEPAEDARAALTDLAAFLIIVFYLTEQSYPTGMPVSSF